MYNVTVHLFAETFTIPCQTKHDQLMVIAEWQRLGLDAEVSIGTRS